MITLELSNENESFGKTVSATSSLTISQYLKALLMPLLVILTCDFLKILCSKVSQHLEDLHNLENRYFSNDQACCYKIVHG